MRRDPGNDPALQLVPASGRSRGFLFALTVGVPVLATMFGVAMGRVPTGASWWGIGNRGGDALIAMLVVALVTGAIALFLDRMLKRHRLLLDSGAIEIATTFYRQRIAFADLKPDAARVVRLDEHPDLKPMLKTNGYALPGFRSGWFRLRNRHKAFVAASDGERLLWLPTTRGFDLLLQPRDPQRLLDRLRELVPSPAR
ncbi:MAG: PH domain-containing protein [Thermomonas sp.]